MTQELPALGLRGAKRPTLLLPLLEMVLSSWSFGSIDLLFQLLPRPIPKGIPQFTGGHKAHLLSS